MSNHLRHDESVGHALKRIDAKDLRSAIRGLDDAEPGQRHDDAVHERRRSVKTTRAVLQLVPCDSIAALRFVAFKPSLKKAIRQVARRAQSPAEVPPTRIFTPGETGQSAEVRRSLAIG